eukprot:1148237-Pelagomonas_calceolata.AAC.1
MHTHTHTGVPIPSCVVSPTDPPTPPADDHLPSHLNRKRASAPSALDKHERNLAQQALQAIKSQPLLLSGEPGA